MQLATSRNTGSIYHYTGKGNLAYLVGRRQNDRRWHTCMTMRGQKWGKKPVESPWVRGTACSSVGS
jgi:hypothetical protein